MSLELRDSGPSLCEISPTLFKVEWVDVFIGGGRALLVVVVGG